jgi:hypothetical protein
MLGGRLFRYQAKIENGSERARRYTYKRAANIGKEPTMMKSTVKATARKYGGVYKPRIYHSVEDSPGRFITGYDDPVSGDFATRVEAVACAGEAYQKSFGKLAVDYQALRERQAAEQERFFAKARWLIGDDGLARMRQN